MKVEKIIIDVGNGTKLEFTPDQARELHKVLGDALGIKMEKEYVPIPYTVPTYPHLWWQPVWTGTTCTLSATTTDGAATTSLTKVA